MTSKIGRNDPCHCGSGKKFKHCHGKPEAESAPPPDSHEGAVQRALAWLGQHHRKGFALALHEAIASAALACFDGDEVASEDALAGLDEETWEQVQLNLTEWMLAQGQIKVKGQSVSVPDLVLGPTGPLMTVGQRAWLAQQARRPLRLYDVTDVLPGQGVTVCDALDTALPPISVAERAGSHSMQPGMKIAARVMDVAQGQQFSGAVYAFTGFGGRAVLQALRETPPPAHISPAQLAHSNSVVIIQGWLMQYLREPPLPDFVDAATGEALVFTSDHYEVHDWDALSQRLQAQADVQGSREAGWDRFVDIEGDEAGATRLLTRLSPQAEGRRLSLQTRSAGLADSARQWFEALAGGTAKFLLREISDPKGFLRNLDRSDAPAMARAEVNPAFSAAQMTQAMDQVIKRHYARWADETVPALDNQTPRQAMRSAAGLERVKGLLRYYEDNETRMAAEQGRAQVSYQFLWDELGLQR